MGPITIHGLALAHGSYALCQFGRSAHVPVGHESLDFAGVYRAICQGQQGSAIVVVMDFEVFIDSFGLPGIIDQHANHTRHHDKACGQRQPARHASLRLIDGFKNSSKQGFHLLSIE